MEYKLLALLIAIFLIMFLVRKTVEIIYSKEEYSNLGHRMDKNECFPNKDKCGSQHHFDEKELDKIKKQDGIEKLYMKNERNILLGSGGAIIWEDDHPPSIYYGEDNFKKVQCPNSDYYSAEDTCWVRIK